MSWRRGSRHKKAGVAGEQGAQGRCGDHSEGNQVSSMLLRRRWEDFQFLKGSLAAP